MSLYVVRKAALDDLAQRAAKNYPASRSLQARWLRSVRWLRSRGLWVLDRDSRAPDWKASCEIK